MDETVKTDGKERKKRAIKKFAIIFIVVLLLLTFFSNTIMNYSLPEVATTTVTSGTVTQKVRCQGTVQTSKDVEVNVSGNRKVKEVLVESGDEVKKGQVIATFDETENTELKEAEKNLKDKEMQHEKNLLKEGPDYTEDYIDIEKSKQAIADAQTALNEAKADAASADAAKAEADALQGRIDAQSEVVAGIKAKFDSLSEAYNYNEVQENINRKASELSDAEKEIENLTAEIEDLNAQLAIEGADIDSINQQITEKTSSKTYNEQKKAQLETEIAELEASIADVTALSDQLAEESAKLEELKNEQIEKQGEGTAVSGEEAVKTAEEALKTAQENYDTKIRALEKKKKQDAIDKQTGDMDMQKEIEELEELRLQVEKLKDADDSASITAPADGILTNITIKEGDAVTKDNPIATIQLAESGYEVETTISKAEGQLIHAGDEATMENVWSADATASVKSIKPDPNDPAKNLIVKFEVKGEEISIGQTIQFAVGSKSSRYDCIVPNNALKEDSKGNFVLVVKVKGTPLGNRYIIKRVDVTKQASDTTKTAVSGDVSEYDNIVTNSSKRLENGQQVRLSEKQ